jgi:hypothetical protein
MANSIAILAVYTLYKKSRIEQGNQILHVNVRFFIAVTNINNYYYLWQNYEESQQKKYEGAKN